MENKTDKLLEALEAAKKQFKPLAKNGKNNFFKTQNGVHEYSTLVDIKNQFIQSKSVIGGATNTPQQNGSGITYYRRYHIQAMLNLEADFDDDGNKASNVEKKEEKKQPIKGGL